MEWTEKQPRRRRGKYGHLLDIVRVEQGEHPSKWMLIAEFELVPSARELSTRLKYDHQDFDFYSEVDQYTRIGKVFARYKGNDSNDKEQQSND